MGAAALYAACSAGDAGSTIGEEGGGGDGSTTTTGNTGGSTSTGEGGIDFSGSGGHQGGGFPCDDTVTDFDQDGFSTAEGDCNDCDPNVNPGAVEVQTDPMTNPDMIDEDCDGEIDEVIPTCDAGIFFDEIDAMKAAQTIELCDVATPGGKDYGVLQAFWGHANGAQAVPAQQPQFGMQADFGPNVQTQAGDRMLVLSSGHARLPTQANAATNNSANPQGFTPLVPPAGFPQNVPGCDGGTDIYDDIALNLRLRAPTNATGFKYRFKFYSFEFAEYVCTNFNDQYIALVNPPPMGSLNGNISFDSNNNPVSVNLAFFDVCDPVANNDFAAYCLTGCPAQPNPYCPLGPAELAGNGFDDAFGSNFEDAGGTSWLETTAPIDGGSEFDIRFAIWDTGDSAYDSSVLIDGFQWVATPGTQIGTVPPPPQ
ncbi:MAG: choice-of-anchor L domain-containing protein [Polyangiaceae bacterium]